jgi:hydrogenase-4 membrane subunit HyfE
MAALLIALLAVMIVPLFVATWRTSLMGLAFQGGLIGWIALQGMPPTKGLADWLSLGDLLLLRALAEPLLLHAVLLKQRVPARSDVVPPSLLSWAMALGFVLVAFAFAERLEAAAGVERTLVAVATSGLLLGLLVLSTQTGVLGQMIGALRVENAIALLEVSSRPHEGHVALRVGALATVIVTIGLFRWYLSGLGATPAHDPEPKAPPEPTL